MKWRIGDHECPFACPGGIWEHPTTRIYEQEG